MKIEVKKFNELQVEELYKLLQLRASVFVVEQECAYQDMDGKDERALHIIGKAQNEIVAYTRVFNAGSYLDKASIGRVAVKKNFRTFGYGREIVVASIDAISWNFNETQIQLSAQTYLIKFYEDFGFQKLGEEYLEDGIPHIMMLKN